MDAQESVSHLQHVPVARGLLVKGAVHETVRGPTAHDSPSGPISGSVRAEPWRAAAERDNHIVLLEWKIQWGNKRVCVPYYSTTRSMPLEFSGGGATRHASQPCSYRRRGSAGRGGEKMERNDLEQGHVETNNQRRQCIENGNKSVRASNGH